MTIVTLGRQFEKTQVPRPHHFKLALLAKLDRRAQQTGLGLWATLTRVPSWCHTALESG